MPKYNVDPDDPAVIEAMALGALMILDMVEQAEQGETGSATKGMEPDAEALALGALAAMDILKRAGTFEKNPYCNDSGQPPQTDNEKDH